MELIENVMIWLNVFKNQLNYIDQYQYINFKPIWNVYYIKNIIKNKWKYVIMINLSES